MLRAVAKQGRHRQDVGATADHRGALDRVPVGSDLEARCALARWDGAGIADPRPAALADRFHDRHARGRDPRAPDRARARVPLGPASVARARASWHRVPPRHRVVGARGWIVRVADDRAVRVRASGCALSLDREAHAALARAPGVDRVPRIDVHRPRARDLRAVSGLDRERDPHQHRADRDRHRRRARANGAHRVAERAGDGAVGRGRSRQHDHARLLQILGGHVAPSRPAERRRSRARLREHRAR